MLIDCTKGVQYLNEIKDSVVAGFQWATKEVCWQALIRTSDWMLFVRVCCVKKMLEEFGSTFMMLLYMLMPSIVVEDKLFQLLDVFCMPAC